MRTRSGAVDQQSKITKADPGKPRRKCGKAFSLFGIGIKTTKIIDLMNCNLVDKFDIHEHSGHYFHTIGWYCSLRNVSIYISFKSNLHISHLAIL